mmetsp:Transcript_99083/g.156206  ORF Transcript_99083/g.156206 Transcript_99083/m.156206 type:complete len:126 (-) Transcript_99083:144-521(-)
MRTSALGFIRDVLAADGFFLLAEWDNPGIPIDFSIYYDLEHYLPTLFFSDPAPTSASIGQLNAEYLSVQSWAELLSSHGVPYNAARSRLPFTSGRKSKVWLDPFEASERMIGRNFVAVFGGQVSK